MGHAVEFIQADTLARYYRLMGSEVFFSTGTDEHGQKVFQKAAEKGEDVQRYVDHYANEFQKLGDALALSNDNFIRTTDPAHQKAAQELWKRCAEKGDIYKKKYTGLYCVGCELFLKENDLEDGKCPHHPNLEPQEIEEENYFFALSKYEEYLTQYLSRDGVIVPEWRREEALAFVRGGLEDFSVSREKARMSWGVPVPDDDEQVMYVWFDALTNYISTLGWPEDADGKFKTFWAEGQTIQLAGKDQVRFQSIIWQAMLYSAGLPATKQIAYHGFINSGGQKMSKSLGNVISPYELVERYGTEATRFLLLRHVHPFEDTDVTWERLDEWYTADLANGLGNLVARVMKMAEDNLKNSVTPSPRFEYGKNGVIEPSMEEFRFQDFMGFVWRQIGKLDEKITAEQPFKVIKENPEKGKAMIVDLVNGIWEIALMLEWSMPETSKIIKEAVLANKKPETLFARIES